MFSEHFAFKFPTLVNFVGGGGKTSLILKLADECSSSVPVIYTTTTRIHPPGTKEGLVSITCDEMALLRSLLERVGRECSNCGRIYVITTAPISQTLLAGVRPDFALNLDRRIFPMILNEADGARSMSLKMPREGEPVLMKGAQYLVPVVGLDCLNKPLGPETLFRWEMAARRYSLKEGQVLTPELASSLLLHPEGVCKDWVPSMKLVPYINKVDSSDDEPLARELAQVLLRNERFPIERVVWGSLRSGSANAIVARRI